MGTDAEQFLTAVFTNQPELFFQLKVEPSNPTVWDMLFLKYYKESPTDVAHDDYPVKRRLGSTDPRWDSFLRQRDGFGAMKALAVIIEKYDHGQIVFNPPTQEAA